MPLPFLLRRSWESGGFFPRACRERCFMALRPGNRTVHRWGAVGLWTLPHRPAGSRKAEGAFPSAPDGTMLNGSQSRKSHSPLPGYSGALALPHYPAGSRKAEQAFPQSRRGHCFMALCPEIVQSIAGALWGYGCFRITLPEMGAVP